MARCLRPRAGAAWPVALPHDSVHAAPTSPRKRRALAGADAVIAVSRADRAATSRRARRSWRRRGWSRSRTRSTSRDSLAAAARHRRRSRRPLRAVRRQARAEQGRRPAPAPVARGRVSLPARDRRRRSAARVDRTPTRATSASTLRVTGWLPRDAALAWLRHARRSCVPLARPGVAQPRARRGRRARRAHGRHGHRRHAATSSSHESHRPPLHDASGLARDVAGWPRIQRSGTARVLPRARTSASGSTRRASWRASRRSTTSSWPRARSRHERAANAE